DLECGADFSSMTDASHSVVISGRLLGVLSLRRLWWLRPARNTSQFAFGFALAICFDPFTWTGATSPRWALLAVSLPLLCQFGSRNHFTLAHLTGLVFIAWATISLIWTANLWDALGAMISLLIICQSVVFGTRITTSNLAKLFMGLS